jgi:hypothetical protein
LSEAKCGVSTPDRRRVPDHSSPRAAELAGDAELVNKLAGAGH